MGGPFRYRIRRRSAGSVVAAAFVSSTHQFCDRAASGSDDPVPLVTFHGTSDQYEPFDGGVENAPLRGELPTDLGGMFDELPVSENPILESSVPGKVALWAHANGCEADPASSVVDEKTTRWEYTCPEADPVVFYEIATGTHWWNITGGFDTNEKLWDFLSSQTR